MAQAADAPEFRLLGPLEVRARGELVPLGGRKPRALLADLLLSAGDVLSVDRLIDDLWGASPPRTASASLQNYVSHLRRALVAAGARDLLVTQPPGYRLGADEDSIDAGRFERLLAEGAEFLRAGEPAQGAAALQAALRLWRGPALADFAYEPFAQAAIARLEELRLEALEDRIECDLALGHEAQVLGELEELTAANPVRERLWGQLMVALYRTGRQADALAAYRTLRGTLDEELGLEPGPALRALEVAILRQDASLLGAPARRRRPGPDATRHPVVVLACGLGGPLLDPETVDPEALDSVLRRCHATAAAVVERHGGVVEAAGDELAGLFGAPLARDDDALRAAHAAVELRSALAALGDAAERDRGSGLEPRLALEAGEALVTGARVTGDVRRRARALERSAAPAQIVVGPGALPLLPDAVVGPPTGGGAAPLLGLRAGGAAAAEDQAPPLVGRRSELAELREALEATAARHETRVAWILGPAGIGKSRLARELVRSAAGSATVLAGRCSPYGPAAGVAPLAAIVRAGVGDLAADAIGTALAGEEDAGRVAERLSASLTGGGAPVPVEELPWLFRRFCEGLARRRPLLLVLDDVHAADPGMLDVLGHLARRSRGAPILVLCAARDDLFEEHPELLDAAAAASIVRLAPLAPEESEELADRLLAGAPVEPRARARALAAAEGNPFFLEQMLASAADPGSRDGDGALPPSIRALLAARLDRLGPGERAVLDVAAVVGGDFSLAAVTPLLDPAAAATAGRHVDGLVRRRLLDRAGPAAAFDEALRFRSSLVRDAALRALPKERRAELHERRADLLAREAGADAAPDAVVGHHLEQAYRLRTELGPVDRHAARLAEDAGERLATAGLHAWRRSDAGAAVGLLARATSLLPAGAPRRAELLCELAIAHRTAGRCAEAAAAIDEAIRETEETRDRRVELRGRIERAAFRLLAGAEGTASELLELAASATPLFEALGDDRALGRAWMLSGWVQGGVHGRNAAWQEAAERALVHYRRWAGVTSTCVGHVAAALAFGPVPVAEAIERCRRLLAEDVDGPAAEASVLAALGALLAMEGRFDEGLEAVARARVSYEELGQPTAIARTCEPARAGIAMLAGDLDDAERALREACDLLGRLGDGLLLATQAAALAEVLYRRGAYGEAERWASTSEELSSSGDASAEFSWRAVRAKLLARRGEHAAAEARAREAVALAEQTDALNQHAAVLLDAAEVHRLAARPSEAAGCADAALRLYERKGNVAAERVARKAFAHA